MRVCSRAGKAVILALFSVSLANCDRESGAQPKRVETPALQAAATDSRVRAFYEARQWQPAWDGAAERTLVELIDNAMAHGLKPSLFLRKPLPEGASEREAALTQAALRYASALSRGFVDPGKLGNVYTIPRPNPNLAAGLAQALQQGDLHTWFASLPPQTDEYRALSQAHLQYIQATARSRAVALPAGKLIKPGGTDPRLPAIAVALTAGGYLPPLAENTAPPSRYTPALVAAVRRLQADYGLKPDGVIGDQTVGALNSGPAQRARQVAVALERLRWLERDPPSTRIDVNTAAAFLDYYRGGRLVDQRRVVVGEPGWETPQLQSNLFQLVANPLWRPPESIIEDELAAKSGAWLARNGFEWRNGRLVQRSGEKNSLGLVKFDLDNKNAIYLHDTPAKALFAENERHRSHGCIRVHNALQFAAVIASENGVIGDFEQDLATGDESYVKLPSEIPVRLLYHTAFWDGSRVQFRPDLYGWDDDIARGLGFEAGPRRPRRGHQRGDIGP